MEDDKIIELYFSRSENAIVETDKKYGRKCRAAAYNILQNREDSEECTNDTYLRLWNAIPPKKPSALWAYIMRTVRNLAIDMIKRSQAAKRPDTSYAAAYEEISDCIPAPDNVTRAAEEKELTELIEKFLDTFSREKKTIFLMRYFSFRSVSDIARELGIGQSKVTVTLMRMRKKLKEYLEKEGIGI